MAKSSAAPMSDDGPSSAYMVPCTQPSSSIDSNITTPGTDDMAASGAENHSPPASRRRRPVPGKGFNKSRRGCFNCKRRRVKCSEARPECRGCSRMGLMCVYPSTPEPTTPQAQDILSTGPKSGVNLDHLRFFRHFLLEAYPPAPHDAQPVWHEVAGLSHEYEFLANAILGLAAQHLTLFHEADYSIQALDLRVAAINGLNEALSQPCVSSADADARYAAIIALTYQSAYMPDAMMEFITMMRGWMFIQTKVVPDLEKSMFRDFTRDSFIRSMRNNVERQLHHKSAIVMDDFLASLGVVRSWCRGTAEIKYLSALERLGRLARESPMEAFVEMVPCFALTNKMSEDEFRAFTHPSNGVARVLLAHFFMLNYALEVHFLGPAPKHFAFCRRISTAWVVRVAASLPKRFQRHMMWPLGMAGALGQSM